MDTPQKPDASKFAGRKVTITIGVVIATTALAYFDKMNGDIAMVFTGAIASFNYALRNSG